MEWIFSSQGLVTIIGIIVILILLAVLLVIIFVVKTIKDIRDTVSVVRKTTSEIDSRGFVPFMKDSQMRSDLGNEIKKKLPKVLPIVTSSFIYSALKKMAGGAKKKRATKK